LQVKQTKKVLHRTQVHTRTKVDSKTKKFKLQNIMQKQEQQQTAIEQFAIALYEGGYLQGNGDEIQELLEQHLEMEKERIENAWIAALDFGIEKIKGLNTLESKDAFEKFYKTTYGGNK
jgi:hypothetical protein